MKAAPRKYIMSAAPQCIFPDANIGPALAQVCEVNHPTFYAPVMHHFLPRIHQIECLHRAWLHTHALPLEWRTSTASQAGECFPELIGMV